MYRRKKKKSRVKLLLVIPFGICAIFLFRGVDSVLQNVPSTEIPQDSISAGNTHLITTYTPEISSQSSAISEKSDIITNTLALVNSVYGITDYNDFSAVTANTLVSVANNEVGLDETALYALDKLFDEASTDGFSGLYANSGMRDYEKQAQLYDESKDKSYVQKPGYSEHHTGLAVDIADTSTWSLEDGSPQFEWLKNNAHKYGFILRYSADKVHLTGISYEPWHYRYVGVVHAYYMYENGLCFEEYIDFLKQGNGYGINIDGEKYFVWYVTANNDEIAVPSRGDYEISRDNTGGYIITAKGD